MASSQLLDINVDTLFEQYSIGEIDQVHKRLQINVEEKREELRMMVGERYRDLLQAADTIGEMKHTSSNVIEHVDKIILSCRRLNDQQLIGFKLPSTPTSRGDGSDLKLDKTITNYYGIVAQIRLLTVLPELIWTRLDTEDFFVATQLFIFSRHISTGLQLDTNSGLIKKFSVAKRQWNILNQFFFTIKQKCLDTLERPDLQAETAAKCLASLMLLENCQMDKLLALFTQLRAAAFRKVIKPDASEAHRGSQQIKEKILAGLKLLNETVVLLAQCFIDSTDERSFLVKELDKITGSKSKPTISYLDMDDSVITATLPSMITKFKPHIQIKPLAPELLQKPLNDWFKATEDDSNAHMRALINDVGSVRTIHGIKTAALELKPPADWPQSIQRLGQPTNLDFYQLYCQPLIRDRIKEIITTSWERTVEKTHAEVTRLIDCPEIIWTTEGKSFWAEDSADTPTSLKQALSADKQSHKLLMKTKGFSKEICQICNLLDTNVETLYKDLSLYLSAGASDQISNPNNDDEKRDREKVIEFLRDCSQEGITGLITSIKTTKTEKYTQKNIILLARLLKAFTEICPNLKLCLTQTLLVTSTWDETQLSTSSLSSNHLEFWDRICRLLDEEALALWKRWVELFVADLVKEHNGYCFITTIDLITLLTIFPNWDRITVEEKDDENQLVESVIRVPSQPSIPLQDFLYKCCNRLNQTIPNTLPKAVTHLLSECLIDRLRITYTELLSANDFIATNQNSSLQYFFDLKFLNLLFGIGKRTAASMDNRESDALSTLANTFKGHIDPFDFEMFHKHVTANIKKATQRMQHQFGLLVPDFEHLTSTTTGAPIATTQDKDPNMLALSVGTAMTNMFPLLPIVLPMTTVSASASPAKEAKPVKAEKVKSRKSPQKSSGASVSTVSSAASSAQQNLANVKSNAAAFFGAMSQDWFR